MMLVNKFPANTQFPANTKFPANLYYARVFVHWHVIRRFVRESPRNEAKCISLVGVGQGLGGIV